MNSFMRHMYLNYNNNMSFLKYNFITIHKIMGGFLECMIIAL